MTAGLPRSRGCSARLVPVDVAVGALTAGPAALARTASPAGPAWMSSRVLAAWCRCARHLLCGGVLAPWLTLPGQGQRAPGPAVLVWGQVVPAGTGVLPVAAWWR